jgi:hypothetical protein
MKSKKLWITVCIIIFLIGIAGSLWVIFKPHGQTIRIVQDGKTLYTIDLSNSSDRTIEVEYHGSKNIIEIKNHKICVKEADCPDQTCVKMGELESNAAPIVCLPNKLVIEFTESDDVDAEVR